MDLARFELIVGWPALLGGVATIATAVTGILFFTVGERFGRINDAASVFQMLFMVPVSVGVFLLIRESGPWLALLATAVGVVGMLVAAVLQALLVFGAVKYEQTIRAVLAAGAAVGLWFVLADVLALGVEALPDGLAACGIVVGSSYVLLALVYRIGGREHPLGYAGAMLAVIGHAVWSLWLGWLTLSGRLAL